MNEPLISTATGSFTSSLQAVSDPGKTLSSAASDLQGIEFAELMAQQSALPELLDELKGLLPEQDFSHIEALISSGNSLPQAAETGIGVEPPVALAPFPVAATLVLAQQQIAAAQQVKKESPLQVRLQLPDQVALPVTTDSRPASGYPGEALLPEGAKTLPLGIERSPAGLATQLQSAEVESIAGQALKSAGTHESAAGQAAGSSLSAVLKAAEAAAPMRLGAPPTLTLETPLAAKGWEQGMGDRILWMLGNSMQSVSLRITPAHLGPIEIQLSVQQDQASVSFGVQHAVVREALEASIPRLREMLQENNLQLAHVDVGQRGGSGSGQQTAGGGARDGQDSAAGEQFDRTGYDPVEQEAQTLVHASSDGLLNDYA